MECVHRNSQGLLVAETYGANINKAEWYSLSKEDRMLWLRVASKKAYDWNEASRQHVEDIAREKRNKWGG